MADGKKTRQTPTKEDKLNKTVAPALFFPLLLSGFRSVVSGFWWSDGSAYLHHGLEEGSKFLVF